MFVNKVERGLILVTYYVRTLDEMRRLLDAFETATNLRHQHVLVVDNSGSLQVGKVSGDRFIQVTHGSNTTWEFSGWLEGLNQISDWRNIATITLLNDSYQRNWTVTSASRHLVRSMYEAADRGLIAGWLENFTWFRRPRFNRRPNSRLIVIPRTQRLLMSASIQAAIDHCQNILNSGTELFDKDEKARLQEWIASQPGRWAPTTMPARLQRIYLEHHLFDGIPTDHLALFPRTRVDSLIYSILRRIYDERR